MYQVAMAQRIHSFCRDVIFVIPVSNRFLVVSSASTIQAYLVLIFPILRQVSPRQFTGVLQGIAACIGISHFLQPFFIFRLNSSSSGSMKYIPRKLLFFQLFLHCRLCIRYFLMLEASENFVYQIVVAK